MKRLAEAIIAASTVALASTFALAEAGDPPAPDAASDRGSLSQETSRRYVQRVTKALRVCYVQQLAIFPELSGRVEIRFVIAPNGQVSSASIVNSTVRNAEMEQCLVRILRGITFPRRKEGSAVVITYPFRFEPPRGAPQS
jgi:TonB family protein